MTMTAKKPTFTTENIVAILKAAPGGWQLRGGPPTRQRLRIQFLPDDLDQGG